MNGVIGAWGGRECQMISRLCQGHCHGKAPRVLEIRIYTVFLCGKDQSVVLQWKHTLGSQLDLVHVQVAFLTAKYQKLGLIYLSRKGTYKKSWKAMFILEVWWMQLKWESREVKHSEIPTSVLKLWQELSPVVMYCPIKIDFPEHW